MGGVLSCVLFAAVALAVAKGLTDLHAAGADDVKHAFPLLLAMSPAVGCPLGVLLAAIGLAERTRSHWSPVLAIALQLTLLTLWLRFWMP